MNWLNVAIGAAISFFVVQALTKASADGPGTPAPVSGVVKVPDILPPIGWTALSGLGGIGLVYVFGNHADKTKITNVIYWVNSTSKGILMATNLNPPTSGAQAVASARVISDSGIFSVNEFIGITTLNVYTDGTRIMFSDPSPLTGGFGYVFQNGAQLVPVLGV